ncbi:NifB/NifX family molybdenum-iron cluster-binding protein [Chloroflexus aggregans]|uniref:Dinitrogenase iron-molybdenum cofactor biosynthesis protein n=1 Tax=Chloroflexus aggregans (strain MD-66 / DSM 9485) TaxID=326427 RepID=B8G8C0_CHLAD|nr:NifB/NifX family molybdenum-iron cluster-binding protein [Chloroflexus aggregans]ACL26174.1 Dinitrogenase iron-molybdenum cofactor biosynthesis protein [Chloroflexus aggregans DSM 9485]
MKIAFATDDHHTISPHLGRAQWYEVVTIEQGQVVNREARPKGRHHHHGDEEHDHHHHHHRHDAHHWLVEAVSDCQMIVARGMGEPAFQGVQAAGIQAICTPLRTIDEAVQAYVNGTLTHHPERVHHRH